MDFYIFNHISRIDPFVQPEDIQEAYFVNEYDLFVSYKNGEKYIIDTFHNTFSGFYPEGYILSDEEWEMSFRKRLRQRLSRRRMTQEELANRLGISRTTVNRYINGETIPSALMLKKISLVLNCDINEFFYAEF